MERTKWIWLEEPILDLRLNCVELEESFLFRKQWMLISAIVRLLTSHLHNDPIWKFYLNAFFFFFSWVCDINYFFFLGLCSECIGERHRIRQIFFVHCDRITWLVVRLLVVFTSQSWHLEGNGMPAAFSWMLGIGMD